MKKSEMFDMILAKVCEVCEVGAESVLNCCRVQSVVEARVLCVYYMRKTGLSNDDIALIVLRKVNGTNPTADEVKKKSKGVDKMFYSYLDYVSQSYAFCLMDKEIKKYCRETYMTLFDEGMKNLPTK